VQYFQGFAIFHDCQGGEGVPLVDTLWNILLVESRGGGGEKCLLKSWTCIANIHFDWHNDGARTHVTILFLLSRSLWLEFQ
jgi:hypothetical protein